MRDDRIVEIALPLGVLRKVVMMIPKAELLDTKALEAAHAFGEAVVKADSDMEGGK